MSVWDDYAQRVDAYGGTKRGNSKKREYNLLNYKLPDNMSYQTVLFGDTKRHVAIVSGDTMTQKKVISMPGEDIDSGSMFFWHDNMWLVTDKDESNEVCTKVTAEQCNHLLKWMENGEVMKQWCVISDGTKYMAGYEFDRDFFTSKGATRIAMKISRNEHTIKFGRETRFLIGDEDGEEVLAYRLTKPLKVGHVYNGKGIYAFVLSEVDTTDMDNIPLQIADYYKKPTVTLSEPGERSKWL